MYNKIFLDIHLVYLDDQSIFPSCESTICILCSGSSFPCPMYKVSVPGKALWVCCIGTEWAAAGQRFTMNPWAERWAVAVWSQLGMCNPILSSACQLIQTSSLVHLAPPQSSAKVLVYRAPQDPFLRCLGPVWGAKEMLILLDGVSTAYNIIYTEDTNCSHTRWLHLFHDTFSQRKHGDEASLSLTLAYSLHRLKYSTGWLCNTWNVWMLADEYVV